MSYREVYKCDVCRDETDKRLMVGCNFSGMKKFKLDRPDSTRGVHICQGCLQQIFDQASVALLGLGKEVSNDAK